jgi:signal transduction histidine kinase
LALAGSKPVAVALEAVLKRAKFTFVFARAPMKAQPMNAVTPWPPAITERPNEAVLSAAFEICHEGLAVVECGRILYANPVFARALGCSRNSDMEGKALAHLVSKTPVLSHIFGESFRRQGREFTVLSIRPQAGPKTKLRAANSNGAEAVGRLVSGVAHDFNNLLTGILLYCDLLSATLEGNPQAQRQVKEMRTAGEQGGAMIQQLLTLARHQVTSPRPLSWNDTLSGMQNFLQRLIGEHIQLVAALAPDLEPVEMDPAQMQQVILNLVLNARDAMPDGGKIGLETRNCREGMFRSRKPKNPAAAVEFMVSDSGCGMDQETRSRIFEPFFTTKGPGRGNGLGLATVHNIVAQYGGTIQVESSPGKGTRVVVRLPGLPRHNHKPEQKKGVSQK